jgi:hypothetical protein
MNNQKLEALRDIEGYDTVESMLEMAVFDSVCPGICITPGCNYSAWVEPDQHAAPCKSCGTNTVQSAMYLAGVI